MALNIPTTQTLKNLYLNLLETALNVVSPLADKAFLRVLAAILSAVFTSLYKFAAQETKENLAISASRAGLIRIGTEYDLHLKVATAAQFTATLPATDGTIIPQTVDFVGDSNGIRYALAANSDPATGGLVTLNLTAEITGAAGNLSVSDTLTISTQIPGATTTATITALTTTGADAEATEPYRKRLLSVIRSPGGGGNSADYRNWSLIVPGVEGAYPYAGIPGGGGSPPDRTVYIEADTSIDIDGIAPTALLNQVRAEITTDSETGLSRQPLGLTDATLYILSISRTSFYVEVRGLNIAVEKEAQAKADIAISLTAYFKGLTPWIDGLDPDFEKRDTITDSSITDIVYDVVRANGGYFTGVGFGISPGLFIPVYTLGMGEHAKNGGVTYA